MSEDGERLAVLETQIKAMEARLSALEGNQKWGVLLILGMVGKALFDMVGKQ